MHLQMMRSACSDITTCCYLLVFSHNHSIPLQTTGETYVHTAKPPNSVVKDTSIEEPMDLPPGLLTDQNIQLLLPQIAHLRHVPDHERDPAEILLAHPWHSPEHVLWRLVECLITGVFPRNQPDLHRLDRIGLLLLLLQLVEDLRGLVRTAGPDDLQAREGECEQGDLGLEVRRVLRFERGGGVVRTESVEREGAVLVEFDEKHGVFVVLEHALRLIEETAVLEGGDEIAHRFPFDADVGGKYVVGHGQHAGYDDVRPPVEEGRERRTKFSHVDDYTGRLRSSC